MSLDLLDLSHPNAAAFICYALKGWDVRIIGPFLYADFKWSDAENLSGKDLFIKLKRWNCVDLMTHTLDRPNCEQMINEILKERDRETLKEFQDKLRLSKNDPDRLKVSM